MTPCPSCHGQRLNAHPAGPLTYQHTPTCPHQASEDATKHADHQRLNGREAPPLPDPEHATNPNHPRGGYTRPATPTERTLLQSQGHTLPEDLLTHLRQLTPTTIQRTWPALHEPTHNP